MCFVSVSPHVWGLPRRGCAKSRGPRRSVIPPQQGLFTLCSDAPLEQRSVPLVSHALRIVVAPPLVLQRVIASGLTRRLRCPGIPPGHLSWVLAVYCQFAPRPLVIRTLNVCAIMRAREERSVSPGRTAELVQ